MDSTPNHQTPPFDHAPEAVPQAGRDPFDQPHRSGLTGSRSRITGLVVITLSIAVVVGMRLGISEVLERTGIVAKAELFRTTAVATDGNLSIDGGRVTMRYTPQGGQYETFARRTRPDNFPDVDFHGEKNDVRMDSRSGTDEIAILHIRLKHPLDTKLRQIRWLNDRNTAAYWDSNEKTEPHETTVSGQKAYLWEFEESDGGWSRYIRLVEGADQYTARCNLTPEHSNPAAQNRCRSDMKTLTFAGAR